MISFINLSLCFKCIIQPIMSLRAQCDVFKMFVFPYQQSEPQMHNDIKQNVIPGTSTWFIFLFDEYQIFCHHISFYASWVMDVLTHFYSPTHYLKIKLYEWNIKSFFTTETHAYTDVALFINFRFALGMFFMTKWPLYMACYHSTHKEFHR